MALKVKFSKDPAGLPGGARYVVGAEYALSREEACLWIRRGVIDLASIEPTPLTDEMIALNEANLKPGKALSLGEVLQALAAHTFMYGPHHP